MAWLMSTRAPSGADLRPRRQRPGCVGAGSTDAMLFKSAMRSRGIANSVHMAWSRSSREPRCSPASCRPPELFFASICRTLLEPCCSRALRATSTQRPRQHPRDTAEVVAEAILFRVHRASTAREPSRSTWNTRPPRLEHAASSWRRDLCPPSCRTTVFHVERAPVHGPPSLLRRERFSAHAQCAPAREAPRSGLRPNASPVLARA